MNALLKLFVLLMLVGSPIMSLAQPTVDLTTTKVDADEAGQDIGSILVTRTNEGNTAEALTVYMLSSGSAGYPTDFSTSGMAWHGGNQWSIVIPGNQFSASGTITPKRDNLIEDEETISFILQTDAAYVVGTDTQADITIADDVAVVTLTLDDGAAGEAGQDPGMITVSRTDNGDTSQNFTVYMQSSGSAGYPTDFSTSGMAWHGGNQWSIVIPGNQFSASGTITPKRDNLIEGTEKITFLLEEETTRFYVGTLTPVDIDITDDVAVVTLTLDDGDASEQNEDPGMITVSRTDSGDTSQNFTVYMQSSGSAGYPTDFSTSGMAWHGGNRWSIVIPGNQFSASGTITPRFEEILEGEETVTFTLQEEDTFYFLGLPDEATITIADFIQIIFKDSFEDR